MLSFLEIDLIEPLQRAVIEAGYEQPTPIQQQSIPALLQGRDLLGCAQTGTGKTAAFALPVLQLLALTEAPRGKRQIRALVLAPTRELAAQIADSFGEYGRFLDLRHTMICGGVNPNRQLNILRKGVDILVATPGRLLDFIGQGELHLDHVEMLVLDEADRMLDMGFLPDIRRVIRALPPERQSLLFSATMPKSIADLAKTFLHDPVSVSVTPPSSTVERIDESVLFVQKSNKPQLLLELLTKLDVEQGIVFSRTKHGANRLVAWLEKRGVNAAALHGNKSQSARERAIGAFRDGSLRLLVATDIAARGIDVEGVSHVFNYDLPNEAESYVHRIGRTGRAGRDGAAIAFCSEEELAYLRDIEKLIGHKLDVISDHQFHEEAYLTRHLDPRRPPRPATGRGGRGGGQGRGQRQSQGRGGQGRGGQGRGRSAAGRSAGAGRGARC